MDAQRKKLIFRSEHRGTKEMDIVLGRFARDFLPTCTDSEVEIYEDLLKENDPNLYNWISGRETPPEPVASNPVLQKIIENYK
jgi:antitoxin CptB